MRVRKASLSLKPSKCKIGFSKVDFLGHILYCKRTLKTGRPTTKKECRSLLGMINFYRRYIPNCAEIVAPITELTKNKMPNVVKWGDKQEEAFTKIKECLSSEPILKLPDLNREFILQTDASNQSLGGCLLQMHGGVKHPVFYASKKLIPREQNYSVGEREALAIIWAVKKFHRYLYGQHFTLESDHRPLEYLQTSHSQNPRIMRWSLAIQKRAIRIIFSLTNDVPYTSALYVANNIPTLADRREQLSRKFFNSVLHPSSCLHSLLPPPRDPELIARLRAPSKFPRTATRTKKYQPFLSYALSKYQT